MAARADREALRALLGWEYEAHARVVDGVLALLPGLRTMAGSEDMLAGLVAIRAQLSPVGPTVDDVLRGETAATAEGDGPSQPVLDPTGAELLARCAASGLRRLPAVVGPVFRPGAPGAAVLANYRFGTRLVEPSFAEATLNPGAPPGTTVQYVIWSFTGRRMDRLTAGSSGAPRVLFSTGSHFVVLAVDEPTEDGVPLRVLLREVAESARADAEADDRARQRLRETMRTAMANETPSGGRLPAQWRHPIGVRDDASPFELAVGVR
jgi:hypothetical protein